MSVKAYITREKMIWVNEDRGFFQYNNDGENLTKYVHADHEFCLNIWHQDKLLDLMFAYGAEDYTNQDFLGKVEMDKEDFESMLENERREWSQEDWDSLGKIMKYFEEGHDRLILTCY